MRNWGLRNTRRADCLSIVKYRKMRHMFDVTFDALRLIRCATCILITTFIIDVRIALCLKKLQYARIVAHNLLRSMHADY